MKVISNNINSKNSPKINNNSPKINNKSKKNILNKRFKSLFNKTKIHKKSNKK